MMEGFKKFCRSLRRDHLPLIDKFPIIGATSGTIGSAIVRGSMTGANAIGAALSVVIVAGISWGFKYWRIRKKTQQRMDVREVNGMIYPLDLQGPGTKMHTIVSTQKLVNGLTKKFRGAAQLPPKLQKRIDAHIADAAEAAKHVRATMGGEEVREIEFLRTVVKPMGQLAEEPVGKITVLHTLAPDEIAAAADAAEKAKVAQGQAAAAGIHAGSSAKMTIKPIKLKQNHKKQKIKV